jgi:hypothetical protein
MLAGKQNNVDTTSQSTTATEPTETPSTKV